MKSFRSEVFLTVTSQCKPLGFRHFIFQVIKATYIQWKTQWSSHSLVLMEFSTLVAFHGIFPCHSFGNEIRIRPRHFFPFSTLTHSSNQHEPGKCFLGIRLSQEKHQVCVSHSLPARALRAVGWNCLYSTINVIKAYDKYSKLLCCKAFLSHSPLSFIPLQEL